MRPKDCAYIVEHLSVRFMAMVADHSRQLAEHRAAFGARTEADAKIIAGMRSEMVAARMAVLERDSLISERAKLQAMVNEQSDSAKAAGELLGWTANESPIQAVERVVRERDGLLTQVQDMRAEMERLRAEVAFLKIRDREYEKALDLCEKEEQTPAECIGSLNARIDRLQDEARSDARVREELHRINVELRTEVAALQERLRASIARGDFAQMEVAALKSQNPKHPVKVGEWVKAPLGTRGKVVSLGVDYLEVELTNGPPTRWWPVYMCEPCDPPQTEPVPKLTHPVAVGGYLRRLTGFNTTPAGEVARVTLVDDDDPSQVDYEVMRPNGQKGRWSAKGCEPCDPPEATAKLAPKVGDTVRLVTHPERAQVAKHLQTALQWPWISHWGLAGQTGKVVKPRVAVAGTVAVALDDSTVFARWPIDCLEVVAEATHDTEAGKAAAGAALKTEPVAEEIKVGDLVEVVSNTGRNTWLADVGSIGTVVTVEEINDSISVHLDDVPGKKNALAGYVSFCDVRKVTP